MEKTDLSKISSCKFNMAVECYRHICNDCGWNPENDRRRKDAATETCDRCGKRFAMPNRDYKVETLTIVGRLYGEEKEYKLCPECEASFGRWLSRWQPEEGEN